MQFCTDILRFLLAQLHLDSLIGKRSPKAIRAALTNLPRGSEAYDRAYEDAMERITGQVSDKKELAQQVLSWITCAKRPLTTIELRDALAVEIGESSLDKENFSEVDDMVSVCAGLVTVDTESSIIRLVHYTTQEYFERTQNDWFPNAETDMATICVTYLSFNIFETGPCLTDQQFEERLRLNPLYDYAARNWVHHACKISPLRKEVIDFLKCNEKVEASSQALMAFKFASWDSDYIQRIPKHITALHLAAYLGAEGVTKILLQGGTEINAKNSNGLTALAYAAERGHKGIVKLLLEKSADVNAKDDFHEAALSKAAIKGHEGIVKLLLEKGAEVNARDGFDEAVLSKAAKEGYESTAKLLLEKVAFDRRKFEKRFQESMLQFL